MGITPLDQNDKIAARVVAMLERLKFSAEKQQIECTFGLAAASLLLGQTMDRARADFSTEDREGTESALNDAVKDLEPRLQHAAKEWLGPWGHPTLQLEGAAPLETWKWIKSHQRIPGKDLGKQVIEALAKGEAIPATMSKCRLLRTIRNAMAHGSVWWTPHPTKEEWGVPCIEGVVFASRTNLERCDKCDQILEDKKTIAAKTEKYVLVWVPVVLFNRYILAWAKTLAAAKADIDDFEKAIEPVIAKLS